jgi:hypothetical protein
MNQSNKNLSKNAENKNVPISDCEEAARALISGNENEEREKNITRAGSPELEPEQADAYRLALTVLNNCKVSYAVGAAFARNAYTNIWRPTKDLDIFISAKNLKEVFDTLEAAGFRTEILADHWLSKAWMGSYFIDIIFGTGHNQIHITEDVLAGSVDTELLGVPTRLIPIEELIAAAAFIKERKRYDASDSVHLILVTEGKIDWNRVLRRLGSHRELLLIDLLLFDFIYPGHSDYLPHQLMQQLFYEAQERWKNDGVNPKEFRGTLLDPFSYTVDVEDWGYQDQRRIMPLVNDKGEAA